MRLKKGDTVIVISGRDKGKKGKILRVFPQKGKITVERVNVAKRHQRPTRTFQGGIIEKVVPIQAGKAMLVCPRCHEPTKVNIKNQARVCRECQEMIDKV